MIRILHVQVGKLPTVVEIDPTLETFQKLVGGWLESLGIVPGVSIYCNEEGKLKNLPENRSFRDDVWGNVICGDFVVFRYDQEGNEVSLTDNDIKVYTAMFEKNIVEQIGGPPPTAVG